MFNTRDRLIIYILKKFYLKKNPSLVIMVDIAYEPLDIIEDYSDVNLPYTLDGSAILVDVDLVDDRTDVQQVTGAIRQDYGSNVHFRFSLGNYSETNISKLKEILHALRNSLNVTITVSNTDEWYSVIYPDFVDLVTIIGEKAFYTETEPPDLTGCSQLEIIRREAFISLEYPPVLSTCTALRVIGGQAFFYSRIIPDLSQCTQLEYIGTGAFAWGSSPMPDFTRLPNLEAIGARAFLSLETPDGVNGPDFSNCHKLEIIGSLAFFNITEAPVFGKCSSLKYVDEKAFANVKSPIDISKCTRLVNYGKTTFFDRLPPLRTPYYEIKLPRSPSPSPSPPAIPKKITLFDPEVGEINEPTRFQLIDFNLSEDELDYLYPDSEINFEIEKRVIQVATKLWKAGKLPDIRRGDIIRRSFDDYRDRGKIYFTGERFIKGDYIIDGDFIYDYPAVPPQFTYPEFGMDYTINELNGEVFYARFTPEEKQAFLVSSGTVPDYIHKDLKSKESCLRDLFPRYPAEFPVTVGTSESYLILLFHNNLSKNLDEFINGNVFRCRIGFFYDKGKPTQCLNLLKGFSGLIAVESVPLAESQPRIERFNYSTSLTNTPPDEYLPKFNLFLEKPTVKYEFRKFLITSFDFLEKGDIIFFKYLNKFASKYNSEFIYTIQLRFIDYVTNKWKKWGLFGINKGDVVYTKNYLSELQCYFTGNGFVLPDYISIGTYKLSEIVPLVFSYPEFSINHFTSQSQFFNSRISLLQKEIFLERARRPSDSLRLLKREYEDRYRNIGPLLMATSGPYIIVVGEIYKDNPRIKEPSMSPNALVERFLEEEVFICGFEDNYYLPLSGYTVINVHVGIFSTGVSTDIEFTNLFGPNHQFVDFQKDFYTSFSLAEKELFLSGVQTFPDDLKYNFLVAYHGRHVTDGKIDRTIVNDSGKLLIYLDMEPVDFLQNKTFKCSIMNLSFPENPYEHIIKISPDDRTK